MSFPINTTIVIQNKSKRPNRAVEYFQIVFTKISEGGYSTLQKEWKPSREEPGRGWWIKTKTRFPFENIKNIINKAIRKEDSYTLVEIKFPPTK